MIQQQKKKVTLQFLESQISRYEIVSAQKFKIQNKLKYDPDNILPSVISLLKPLTLYIILIKYSLLVDQDDRSQKLIRYDRSIKKGYQALINKQKLVKDFQFQFFVLITVKISKHIIEEQFKEIETGQSDQRQIYLIIIQILLGVKMHQRAYKILQKKFIDEEKYEKYPTIQGTSKFIEKSLMNISSDKYDRRLQSKKIITMNHIQAKLQRKKQDRLKRNLRSSINHQKKMSELQQFKQNLQLQLKVSIPVKNKTKKIAYQTLQKNILGFREKRYLLNPLNNKNFIQTEQISASLQLSFLLNQCRHSYTRRNIPIKMTGSTPRFSHPVFQNCSKKQQQLQRIMKQISDDEQKVKRVNKKTKTYWNKVTNKIREINNSFEY